MGDLSPRPQVRSLAAIPPPNNRPSQIDESSSDEDDDGIPARKRPSISPQKWLSVPARPPAAEKRPLSDLHQNNIVLYPRSKKVKNAYNMLPRRTTPPSLPLDSLPQPRATTDTRFPSIGSVNAGPDNDNNDDDIQAGLLESINAAFQFPHMHNAAQPLYSPPYQQGSELESAILGWDEGTPEIHDLKSPPPDNSWDLPGSPNKTHNRQNLPDPEASSGPSQTDPLDAYDPYDIPLSPTEDGPRPDQPQPRREKGRLLKQSTTSSVQGPPQSDDTPGKKKVGRPKKNGPRIPGQVHQQYPGRVEQDLYQDRPRLRGETDQSYTTRTTKTQKGTIPGPPESRSSRQSSRTPSHVTVPRYNPGDGHTCATKSSHINPLMESVEKQPAPSPPSHQALADGLRDTNFYSDVEEDDGTAFEPTTHDETYGEEAEDDSDEEYHEPESFFISGFLSDSDGGEDQDLSVEDSFVRDAERLLMRQATLDEDTECFEGPPDDDVTNIHLDDKAIDELCKLLGKSSWTNAKSGWQNCVFRPRDPETKPARAMLPFLYKLEDLYQAAPKAPRFKEQNKFLRQYSDLINYYFRKVGLVVDHIRKERLEDPRKNDGAQNTDPRRRENMTMDLLECIIPTLVHVMATAWNLGGADWREASFTTASVELLGWGLHWTALLSRRLLKELKKLSAQESPETKKGKEKRDTQDRHREKIQPLLEQIGRLLEQAPGRLGKAEAEALRRVQLRQRQQRREEELREQRRLAEEASRAELEQRKQRAFQSMAGHPRLQQHVPTQPQVPAQQQQVSTQRQQQQPQARPTATSTWTREEEEFVFYEIQKSYLQDLDLDHMRWELNKSMQETLEKTEQILARMLELSLPDSAAQVREEIAEKLLGKYRQLT